MSCHVFWGILIIYFMHIINTTLISILIRLMRTRAKVTRMLDKYLIVLLLMILLLSNLIILFFFKILINWLLVIWGSWNVRTRWNIIWCHIYLINLWLIFVFLVVLFWTHLTLLINVVWIYLVLILALLKSVWYWRPV
jgi:hypothetical protein